MGIGAPKDITPCRRFFEGPSSPRQRMYEALRAYFLEGRPSQEVARAYAGAQARHIFRDLIDTPVDVSVSEHGVHVRFRRRAHLPIIIALGILDSPLRVPWWQDYTLRMSA